MARTRSAKRKRKQVAKNKRKKRAPKICRLQILAADTYAKWHKMVNAHREENDLELFEAPKHTYDYSMLAAVKKCPLVKSGERSTSEFKEAHKAWKRKHGTEAYLNLLEEAQLYDPTQMDKAKSVIVMAIFADTTVKPPTTTAAQSGAQSALSGARSGAQSGKSAKSTVARNRRRGKSAKSIGMSGGISTSKPGKSHVSDEVVGV